MWGNQAAHASVAGVLPGPRFWGDIVDACELLVDYRIDNPLYDPGRGTRLPQRCRLAVCGSCGHISARIRHCPPHFLALPGYRRLAARFGVLDPYPEPPEARALEVAPEGSVSPADAESIRLGDAERAFLDKLKGLLEPGEDTTLAGLNRRALGLAEENLRVLGFLETYIPPSASKALRKQQPTPKEAKLGR